MPTYAHTAEGKPEEEWHPLAAHLARVAELAEGFAAAFGAGDWGRCAGLLHDAGKGQTEFQRYLRLSAQGKGRRGSVPHSAHGARLAVNRHKHMGRLLAYAISGHHGGLPDFSDMERRLADVPDMAEAEPFAAGVLIPPKFPFAGSSSQEFGFIVSFFVRMVFSCLVDADWLDTEAFMDPHKAAWREGCPRLPELSARFFPRLEAKVRDAPPTQVNRIRHEVLDACLAAADLPPGLFSLSVPTGGGKTLSSLAFALRHAERHGLARIIYVIPYMSIIEQNADVFREYVGEDAVVEHHSSADPGRGDREDEDAEPARRRARLASENWDAPLVATTAVQFFESLFAAKPSRCRKLHNLAGSVVILDEAQMLPQPLLLPCLAAIRELAGRYGATVVLCTATQPAVTKRDDFPQGIKVHEIIPDVPGLHARLARVRVTDLGRLSDEALADRLRGHEQGLCVVNTRKHARALFERLRGLEGLIHLSANMTPAHRSRKIAGIKAALAAGRPCRVVSTQLVEAGVDVDFPVVYRAAAGLDSVAQAAGRCDREGRLTAAAGSPAGQVFVFTPEDGLPPGNFRIAADKAAEVARLGLYPDLLAPQAVEHYFRLLFWQAGDELDREAILKNLEAGARKGDFCFRDVAEKFRVIETAQLPLIVPTTKEAEKLVRELDYASAPGRILRRLQRHIIQVHPRVWNGLEKAGAARLVLEGLAVLENMELYDEELGLKPDNPIYMSPEGGIV